MRKQDRKRLHCTFCLIDLRALLADELLSTPSCQLQIAFDDGQRRPQFVTGYAHQGIHTASGFASCQFIGLCLGTLTQEAFAFEHQGCEPGNRQGECAFLCCIVLQL